MILLCLLLGAAGWTAILTRGAGPWNLLVALRAAWPTGPLGCPLCTGTWTGLALAALDLAADRWPVLAPALILLVAAGAGALASELYARLHELLAEVSYALRAYSDRAEQNDRNRPPPAMDESPPRR